MARIKLLQDTGNDAPRALHLVMQDIENTVLEIEAAAVDNPALTPAATPAEEEMLNIVIARDASDIQALDEVVETSLPAIGALEDTAYAIAPAIRETTAAHVAMVRQIATVSGEVLGIPAEDLIGKDLDDGVIGQPLVLEGFKEKAAAAAKAIWNAILNLLDRYWTLFQSMFRRTAGRLKRLKAIISEIEARAVDTELKPSAGMLALTQNGSFTTKDVQDSINSVADYAQLAYTMVGLSQTMLTGVISVIQKAKDAKDIPNAFKNTANNIIGIWESKIAQKPLMADGDDFVSSHTVNGKKVTFKGLNVAVRALKNDPLSAAAEFAKVSFSTEDVKLDIAKSINYQASDFKQVAAAIGVAVKELNPNIINHVNGITRVNKRSVETIAAKVTADWTSLVDKAEPADQAAAKPYIAALAQLVNKHASLQLNYQRFVMSALDDVISGGTLLLQQGTKLREIASNEKESAKG